MQGPPVHTLLCTISKNIICSFQSKIRNKNLSALEIANAKPYHDAKAFELQDHIIFICILRMKLLSSQLSHCATIAVN